MKLGDLKQEAVLVYITFSKVEDIDWNIKEFLSLSVSSEILVVEILISRLKIIHSKYFIGMGKLSELYRIVKNRAVSVVLFSCSLSPNQERNLVCYLGCKIIDRNQLILSIFAKHARTYEGKLQVELAHLRYLKSRLVHEWTHLERQTGGIGIRGGPGEKQLEKDRRLLSKRMIQIESNLKKIENQRKQSRSRRVKLGMSFVSLVGYTNAGKSTLFNIMTTSNVDVSKNLFVTLDPAFRKISGKQFDDVILIDTVGFIQNLPSDLIAAFKATLQEITQSTLLLHVVDTSSVKSEQHIDVVNNILNDISVCNIPMLLVMNKIDRVNKIIPRIDRNLHGMPVRVWISAKHDLGIMLLKQAINELIPSNMVSYELKLPINSDVNQRLHKLNVIKDYVLEDNNIIKLSICLSVVDWNRLIKYDQSILSYVI